MVLGLGFEACASISKLTSEAYVPAFRVSLLQFELSFVPENAPESHAHFAVMFHVLHVSDMLHERL